MRVPRARANCACVMAVGRDVPIAPQGNARAIFACVMAVQLDRTTGRACVMAVGRGLRREPGGQASDCVCKPNAPIVVRRWAEAFP